MVYVCYRCSNNIIALSLPLLAKCNCVTVTVAHTKNNAVTVTLTCNGVISNTLLRHIGKVLYGIVQISSAQNRKINANRRDSFLAEKLKKNTYTRQASPK